MTPTVRAEDVIAEYGDAEALRAAHAAFWRRGDIGYRLSGLQTRVRAMVAEPGPRRCGWLASRRAGKSRTNCGIAVETALAYPGVYIPYAAPSAVQVRTFVDPHFRLMANEAPPELALDHANGLWTTPPLQWYDAAGNPVRTRGEGGVTLARYSGDAREEVLRQSTIAPRGCEDQRKADALRGPGTVLALVDEARDIPTLDYVLTDVLGPMLWEARSVWGESVRPRLLITSTAPRRPDHPMVAVWEALLASGAAMHSTIYDADHLSDDDIDEAREECGGEDTLAWRREALAIIERDPRIAVLPEWDEATVLEERAQPTSLFPAVVGDGGFVDLAGYLFGYYDFEAAIYVVEDELVFSRTRSDEQDRDISARERSLWPGRQVERRRVDAPPQVRADMNRPEWGAEDDLDVVEGEEPPHWLGVTKPRAKRMGSMEAGVNRVRKLIATGRLKVHPRCTVLRQHASGARWDRTRTEFVRVVDADREPLHHYDLMAALVYFCRDVNDHKNPYPVLEAGVSLPTHMIRERMLRRTDQDRIASIFRKDTGKR